MCGIAGVVDRRGVDRADLERSLEALHHRGPDESNVWTNAQFGVAHSRLAIIDRAHGTQPMHTPDGRYVSVFNGEIYNHRELRDELVSQGYPLRTRCDSEVLPYLYDAEGPAMVERLRGMFAFAIMDLATEELFVARDRFGKKPLFLASTSTSAAFASTLDALLPLLAPPPSLCPQAIAEYLVLQYVPAAMSPWQGIEKVEPGTWVRWREGQAERCRYWLPPLPGQHEPVDQGDLLSTLRSRIREAVAVRLESEVPLGVFLSGGLDSSVVVAEMSELGITPKTYSVGFEQAAFDERSYAEMVARRFETDHQTLVPELDVESLFHRFTEAYDEPFADSSALATLAVAEAASQHVTVVLTGDGGDELFGGYDRYRMHRVAELAGSIPGPVRRSAALLASGVARTVGPNRITSAARFISTDPWNSYRDHLFHFQPDVLRRLLSPEVRAMVDPAAPVRRLDALRDSGVDSSEEVWLPWVDAQTYLPDDLLTKMDRATMAHGLEARSPLLDHDLWKFVAGLPRSSLIGTRRGKLIMREAYKDVLPAPILRRAKKGFGVPIAAWMRTHLRDVVGDLLMGSDSFVGGLLDGPTVCGLAADFLRGSDEHSVRVWNLLALAGWHDARIGGKLTQSRRSGSSL